jgi:hypothetical protein
MKPQYQHELMTSFMLWFDHELLQKGEAYSNQTGFLYYDEDSRLPSSYRAYSSFQHLLTDMTERTILSLILKMEELLKLAELLEQAKH